MLLFCITLKMYNRSDILFVFHEIFIWYASVPCSFIIKVWNYLDITFKHTHEIKDPGHIVFISPDAEDKGFNMQ
jgi:protein gp37